MKHKTGILFRIGILGLFLLAGCTLENLLPQQVEPSASSASLPATTFTITPFLPRETLETEPSTPQSVHSPTAPDNTVMAVVIQPTPTVRLNPLTGLPAEHPDLLDRRPVLVKIENLPRSSRPQWGLSLADLVFEYHTEEGTTRFAALFYGNNATQVGPIRSGRLFDIELVYMYRSQFIFGGAYRTVLAKIYQQDFAKRVIVEDPSTAPALYRTDSAGSHYLMLDLNALDEVLQRNKIDNTPQDLSDMAFQQEVPPGGEPANQVFVRYSGAIYNRWDYDARSNKYLRYVDKDNAFSVQDETYTQLTDRLTGQPITADNVVMVVVKNVEVEKNIYEIRLSGTGQAYIARDGVIYEVKWYRGDADDILVLQDLQGNPFPFKPGQTWFEILSDPISIENEDDTWRFIFHFPK